MRRRIIYIFLFLLLALACFLKNGFHTVWPVLVSTEEGVFPKEWAGMKAADINRKGITLIIDGKEVDSAEQPIFITDELNLMMPVSQVTEAFSSAVNFYDNSRLVIQKNMIRLELFMGSPDMTVNGRNFPLSEELLEKDNQLYIPLEALESGLSYSLEWEVGKRRAVMTSENPDGLMLPDVYDYRVEKRAPDVKNQGILGTCWAFASLKALETSLMPETVLDFSEDHMSIKNSFQMDQNDGGEYTMSMAYLLAWQGPVLEKDDPYGDRLSPDGLEAVKHVQEIQILPEKNYEKIKEAVFLHGGVQSSLYTSLQNYKSRSVFYNRKNNAYCYIGTEKPNHDVVIVGWDDNYSRDNFNMELSGDGAFLCANSWGADFGEDGYFYVSYYDTNIGIHNILYKGIEEPDNYDYIYQSDLCGWIGQLGYGTDTAYFANVYQAESAQNLSGVGFYATGAQTAYEVYLARHVKDSSDFERRELIAGGMFENAGFYTVPIKTLVPLDVGERFAVIVKITTPKTVHPIAIEYNAEDGKSEIDLNDGEGYISLRGSVWENTESGQNCNVCLKAYTTKREYE